MERITIRAWNARWRGRSELSCRGIRRMSSIGSEAEEAGESPLLSWRLVQRRPQADFITLVSLYLEH
jgi:hypothetical protein